MPDTTPDTRNAPVALDTEALAEWLKADVADIDTRTEELCAAAAELAKKDLTADTAPNAVLLAKQITLHVKKREDRRKEAKAPFDAAGKQVQDAYATGGEQLTEAQSIVLSKLTAYMQAANEDRVDNDYGNKAYWRATDEVVITDPDAVPAVYMAPDTKAIAKALKDGFDVPGVKLVPKRAVVVS